MNMQTNRAFARRQPILPTSVSVDFEFYDKLPRILRFALAELNQRFTAKDTHAIYTLRGTDYTTWALHKQERIEIVRFAEEYKRRCEHVYPFIAAYGSIQRYDRAYQRRYRKNLIDDVMMVSDIRCRRRGRS